MSPSSILVVAALFLSACSPANKARVDELNEQSYAYHYRNLDSTKVLAERALKLSEDYPSGRAEAYNNLAFVCIAKMDYKGAKGWLKKIEEESDNQIELAIADVQNMRLCQRESHNKDFYAYREKAMRRLRRIREEVNSMPPRESKRVIYAKSEFYIVAATYFYYVGLDEPMLQELNRLDPDELEQDSAQYLNYLYNISTKNKAHARDPEMASGKKANTWHFGMKEHIAACSESGIIYGTVAAPANEHDITHLGDLLKGLEKKVFLDSGYIGCHKRAEIQAIPFKDVSWYIAARPSAWKKELSISENFGGELGQALVECVNVKRQLEHAKASVRCSIEWCFLWLKRIYGYAKVRYRGLAKNHSRALTLFALYNCNRLRKWCAPPRLPC